MYTQPCAAVMAADFVLSQPDIFQCYKEKYSQCIMLALYNCHDT